MGYTRRLQRLQIQPLIWRLHANPCRAKRCGGDPKSYRNKRVAHETVYHRRIRLCWRRGCGAAPRCLCRGMGPHGYHPAAGHRSDVFGLGGAAADPPRGNGHVAQSMLCNAFSPINWRWVVDCVGLVGGVFRSQNSRVKSGLVHMEFRARKSKNKNMDFLRW